MKKLMATQKNDDFYIEDKQAKLLKLLNYITLIKALKR